jgi:trimethylamine--corrinoid protein Co-methyltransferase
MATMQAGVNFNLHTAGWLEGGLTVGYEKFILDADQASMAESYLAGVDLSDNGLALQAMLDSGPGQHFLGSPHTLANFENAFWRSELSATTASSMGGGGVARPPRSGPTRAGSGRSPSTRRRPRRRIHERSSSGIDRRSELPDSDVLSRLP